MTTPTITQIHEALLDDWRSRAAFVPLLAAVIAPLSSLLDIPALTEPWFVQNDNRLPDPRVNLTLSAVGLFVNFIANALLVLRFSMGNGWWKWAMGSSLICWIVKLAIAISNILIFGILTRNSPGISYAEGFWCTVVSIFINLFIVSLLLFHYFFVYKSRRRKLDDEQKTEVQVGIAGRHFMLQTTLFIATIAILALFMSRLEDWTYLQGIYFSIVTFLTIGFGDFSPTHTSTQIVLFPFVVAGIIQLGILIEMIVTFISSRERTRHARRRAQYEKTRQEEKDREAKIAAEKAMAVEREGGSEKEKAEAVARTEVDLVQEMVFLRELYENSYKLKVMRDLALNLTGFVLFWLLGAVIFSQIENWTYGQGMYFGYVFFLSIGYGDYAPVTPAGRVIFVLYSIIAVPVMTTFAVQTVQSLVQRISLTRLRHRREEFGLEAEIEEGDVQPKAARGETEGEGPSGGDNGNAADDRMVKENGNEETTGARFSETADEIMSATDVDIDLEAGESMRDLEGISTRLSHEYRENEDEHHEEHSDSGSESDISSESSVELPSEIRERFSRKLGKWKASHAEYVSWNHRKIRRRLRQQHKQVKQANNASIDTNTNTTAANGPTSPSSNASHSHALDDLTQLESIEDRILTEYILEQAVELERRARRLLLASLQEGGNCHTLLKADRIVQLRSIKALADWEEGGERESVGKKDGAASGSTVVNSPSPNAPSHNHSINALTKKYYDEEQLITFSCALEESEMLLEISKYRKAFAGLLAAGSRLMKLKDEERWLFERRIGAERREKRKLERVVENEGGNTGRERERRKSGRSMESTRT